MSTMSRERTRMRNALAMLGLQPFQVQSIMFNNKTGSFDCLRLRMEIRNSSRQGEFLPPGRGCCPLVSSVQRKVLKLICYMEMTMGDPCFTDLDLEECGAQLCSTTAPLDMDDSLLIFYERLGVPPMDMMMMNLKYRVHDLDSLGMFLAPYTPPTRPPQREPESTDAWYDRLLRVSLRGVTTKSVDDLSWAFQRVLLLPRGFANLQDPLYDFSMQLAVEAQCVQFLEDLGFTKSDMDALRTAHKSVNHVGATGRPASLCLDTLRSAAQHFSQSYCKGKPRYNRKGSHKDIVHEAVGFGKRFLLYQAVWYTETAMEVDPEIYRLERFDQRRFILWSLSVNWDLTHWGWNNTSSCTGYFRAADSNRVLVLLNGSIVNYSNQAIIGWRGA